MNSTRVQPSGVVLASDLAFLAEYILGREYGRALPNYEALGRYPIDVAEQYAAALSAPSHGEQGREVPSIQVCKLGRLGAAYDHADTRYAYTYTEQPDNVGAMKLGRAAAINGIRRHGDVIDRGLDLLLRLQAEGFGVFQLAVSKQKQEDKQSSCGTCNDVGIIGHSTLCPDCAAAPSAGNQGGDVCPSA